MDGVSLIQYLNQLAGSHGIGRIDMIENRLVGIKSREIYEVPAGVVLMEAHRALESLTLSKSQLRFKQRVAQEYAGLTYDGLWFSAHRRDLAAYVKSTQQFVSGTVRLKLFKGKCSVVGRKSLHSLYSLSLATYDKGDRFDQSAAAGFIHIWGLPNKTQSQVQKTEDD
jgi:argininosuccinate synthase